MSAPDAGMNAQQGMIASMMARNLEGNGGVGAGGIHMQSIFRLGFPVGGDGQEMGMMRSLQDLGQSLKLEVTALIKDFNAYGLAGLLQTSGLSFEGLKEMMGMGDGGGEVFSNVNDNPQDAAYAPQAHGFANPQSGDVDDGGGGWRVDGGLVAEGVDGGRWVDGGWMEGGWRWWMEAGWRLGWCLVRDKLLYCNVGYSLVCSNLVACI